MDGRSYDLLEAELDGPIDTASPPQVAAAVGRVVGALPPDQLHRAVDLVSTVIPLMPDEAAAQAVADAASRGVTEVATIYPRHVEDWWADLVKDSIVMAAHPPMPDNSAASGSITGNDLGKYAGDLVIIPHRANAFPPAAREPAFVPPKPLVRPHPPPMRSVSRHVPRDITFGEAFRRDAKGLIRAVSDLLTRSIDGR